MEPKNIQCGDDSCIHEFDRKMSIFSIGLAQDLMAEILIGNVRVRKTRSGHENYTDERHHGISADMLARKWSIGLEKEKHTLKYTTQDNVRPALKQLTWQQRTYFLSQRLRQLNFRLYTEKLFSKDKSIFGNT